MVTLEVSLLPRVTVTPPAGAGEGNVTGNATDWPNPTVVLDGKPITPTFTTFTVAVVSASAGALACTTDVPTAMPVTGTATLLLVAAILTVVGTVTAAALLELILITRPLAGAGPVHTDRERLLLETEVSCDLYRLRVSEEARG